MEVLGDFIPHYQQIARLSTQYIPEYTTSIDLVLFYMD